MLGSDDDPKFREAVSIAPDFNPVSIPVLGRDNGGCELLLFAMKMA